jgi:acetyl esterase/lipase
LGLEEGKKVLEGMMKFVADDDFEQLREDAKYESGILPESVHVIEDYQLTGDGYKIPMDIYYRDQHPLRERAAAVFLHGGGFWSGDKKQFQLQAAYLALRHDILAVSLNYRLNPAGRFPAAFQDVKYAIRWLRSVKSQYNIHPAKIVVIGGSPGGNLAGLAACNHKMPKFKDDGGLTEYSSEVNLAVALNGIFDFADFIKTAPGETEHIRQYLGGYMEEVPEIYIKASPLLQVDRLAAPMLLLHGEGDRVIPWQKSLQMYRKLIANGVPAQIQVFKGKGHGWFNRMPDAMEVMGPIERFLHQYQFL